MTPEKQVEYIVQLLAPGSNTKDAVFLVERELKRLAKKASELEKRITLLEAQKNVYKATKDE